MKKIIGMKSRAGRCHNCSATGSIKVRATRFDLGQKAAIVFHRCERCGADAVQFRSMTDTELRQEAEAERLRAERKAEERRAREAREKAEREEWERERAEIILANRRAGRRRS